MSDRTRNVRRQLDTLAWLDSASRGDAPPEPDRLYEPLRRSVNIENPSVPLTAAEALIGDARTDAGITVTHAGSLRLPAVWQAVSLISGDIAKLPCLIYRRGKGEERRIDRRHSAYGILRWKTNSEMTAFFFWRTMMVQALIWNHAFAYIFRDGGARPLEMVPLLPDRTFPTRRKGTLWIVTEIDQKLTWLRPEDVLHIKGISLDAIDGCDMLDRMRNSFAIGLAAQKFASKFFANGANAGGVLTHPGKLSAKAEKNFKESFEEKHAGLDQAHRTILLEEGARWTRTQVAPDEGQMLETRKDEVKNVARAFNMPPHKLGDDSKDGYNGLEQENQAYLDSTLEPWLMSIDTECREKLLTEEQKRTDSHIVEHDRTAFLRSDTATRIAYYNGMTLLGAMNANQVAAAEKLPPTGPAGDVYYRQANLLPALAGGAAPGDVPPPEGGTSPDDEPEGDGKLPMAEDPNTNPPPDDPSPNDML